VKNIPKKFVVLIFAALVLGGGFFVLKDMGRTGTFDRQADTSATSLFADEAQKDADGDGLKDWEEVLWKTDPAKADTDGDGTPDGEEVREKRSPTKAGPDDHITSIAESPFANVITQNEAEKNLTLTDIFARDFAIGFFSLEQSGRLTDANRDKFITGLVAGLEKPPGKEYAVADLVISQKSDAETLRQYGNTLGAIAARYRRLAENKEAGIVNEAVKKDNAAMLEALKPIVADYDAFIAEYLGVPVPISAYEVHLEIVNANAAARDAIAGMEEIFTDPFRGTAEIAAYKKAGAKGGVALRDIVNFFSQNGVVFEKNEPGNIFNK